MRLKQYNVSFMRTKYFVLPAFVISITLVTLASVRVKLQYLSEGGLSQKTDKCQIFTQDERNKLENGYEDQLDPNLLELIRCNWLHPPSAGRLNLRHPGRIHFSQSGQSVILDAFMNRKTGKNTSVNSHYGPLHLWSRSLMGLQGVVMVQCTYGPGHLWATT